MAWARPKAPKGDRGTGTPTRSYAKPYSPAPTAHHARAADCPCSPGQKLHLDHDDWDRTKLRGFSHAECNIRAAAKKARAIQIAAKRKAKQAGTPLVSAAVFCEAQTRSPARDQLPDPPDSDCRRTRREAAVFHEAQTTSPARDHFHSQRFELTLGPHTGSPASTRVTASVGGAPGEGD